MIKSAMQHSPSPFGWCLGHSNKIITIIIIILISLLSNVNGIDCSSGIKTIFINDIDVINIQSGLTIGDNTNNRSTNNNSSIIISTESCLCSSCRDNSTFIAANFTVKQIISNLNYTLFQNSSEAQRVFLDTVSSILLLPTKKSYGNGNGDGSHNGDSDGVYGSQNGVVSIDIIQCFDGPSYSGSSLNLRRSLVENLLISCTDVLIAYSIFFKDILYYNITSVDLAYSALDAALNKAVSTGLFEYTMRIFVESKGMCTFSPSHCTYQ